SSPEVQQTGTNCQWPPLQPRPWLIWYPAKPDRGNLRPERGIHPLTAWKSPAHKFPHHTAAWLLPSPAPLQIPSQSISRQDAGLAHDPSGYIRHVKSVIIALRSAPETARPGATATSKSDPDIQ